MISPKVRRNHGFLMIRRVTSFIKSTYALSENKHCFEYKTEDLHPLELFSRFTVNSTVDRPVQTSYIAHDKLPNLIQSNRRFLQEATVEIICGFCSVCKRLCRIHKIFHMERRRFL